MIAEATATGGTRLTRPVRRLLLTLHVIFSVGWLGLTGVVLTLGIAGRSGGDQAVYPAMRILSDVLLIPVALVSLVSGLALSLGTRWGLFRYWWVVVKLILTLAATAATIFALRPQIHDAAATGGAGSAGVVLIVAPSVGLVVYVVATVLSVYKPWGRTAYGRSAARRYTTSS
jgi:hypothetical protein